MPFKHIVLFKFKSTVTAVQINEITQDFAALKTQVPIILALEWGETSQSIEGLQDGYSHCFDLTFESLHDIQTYLDHPDHQIFVEKVLPLLEKAIVTDFEVQQ